MIRNNKGKFIRGHSLLPDRDISTGEFTTSVLDFDMVSKDIDRIIGKRCKGE